MTALGIANGLSGFFLGGEIVEGVLHAKRKLPAVERGASYRDLAIKALATAIFTAAISHISHYLLPFKNAAALQIAIGYSCINIADERDHVIAIAGRALFWRGLCLAAIAAINELQKDTIAEGLKSSVFKSTLVTATIVIVAGSIFVQFFVKEKA